MHSVRELKEGLPDLPKCNVRLMHCVSIGVVQFIKYLYYNFLYDNGRGIIYSLFSRLYLCIFLEVYDSRQ